MSTPGAPLLARWSRLTAPAKAWGAPAGGLTTKIHAVADLACRPLVTLASPGQRSDARGLAPVMARLRLPRRGRGRPRTRPEQVLADKAYSSAGIRALLRERGIKATIPVKDDQVRHRAARGPRGGRPGTASEGRRCSVTPSRTTVWLRR